MAEKKEIVTYASLRNEIINRKFRPIYVLHGEESFFIDQLSELIVNNALTEDQQDFNLSIYYGNDADVNTVINTCKQYPAFSDLRVVVLREAQNVSKQPGHKNDLDLFKYYAESPMLTTILVICYKGDTMKSKPFLDALKEMPDLEAMKGKPSGVVFVSPKITRTNELHALIKNYVTSSGCNIDIKSISMIADFIGNDISRLFGELDKLRIIVGEQNTITPELIENNIGISKDYNNYELEDALRMRRADKAYRIIDYYEKNPQNNRIPPTLSMLFSFFTNVLIVRSSKDKSIAGLMAATGNKSEYRIKKFQDAASNYSTRACVNIISYLRECDVKSKGIGSRQDKFALLRELIYKILHS